MQVKRRQKPTKAGRFTVSDDALYILSEIKVGNILLFVLGMILGAVIGFGVAILI